MVEEQDLRIIIKSNLHFTHHFGSLDVADAEDDLREGVGADQLHQDHVRAVAHLRLDGIQLHCLQRERWSIPSDSTSSLVFQCFKPTSSSTKCTAPSLQLLYE